MNYKIHLKSFKQNLMLMNLNILITLQIQLLLYVTEKCRSPKKPLHWLNTGRGGTAWDWMVSVFHSLRTIEVFTHSIKKSVQNLSKDSCSCLETILLVVWNGQSNELFNTTNISAFNNISWFCVIWFLHGHCCHFKQEPLKQKKNHENKP